MTAQRVMTYRKSNKKVLLSVSDTYIGDTIEVEMAKKKTCSREIRNAATLPKKNMVSQEKKRLSQSDEEF
ncbi:hypothetical protein ANN_03914 [Periplaneta americana]|uniref:Uncharacterized protein n=1 Tax=Periplaneta americana TaxID=6978 RepID=A0ABQ8T7V4_PERAM|nr:hypothetical protein ANN_03914 [Periplaneta americana]